MTELYKTLAAQMLPKQRKRYLMFASGMTYQQIAEKEGVSKTSVWESVNSGEKRAKRKLRRLTVP